MRIVICRAHVPFEWGGAEIFTQSLKEELEKRGHEADVVALPFKWYPKIEIIKNCLAWRLLDLSSTQGVKVDAAICTNFPSYVLKHPAKIMWLNHQFRAVYDLRGTEFDDFLNAFLEESSKFPQMRSEEKLKRRLKNYFKIRSTTRSPSNTFALHRRILFDFFLAYRELYPDKWTKVRDEIKIDKLSIGKWHDKCIRELMDFSSMQQKTLLNTWKISSPGKKLK